MERGVEERQCRKTIEPRPTGQLAACDWNPELTLAFLGFNWNGWYRFDGNVEDEDGDRPTEREKIELRLFDLEKTTRESLFRLIQVNFSPVFMPFTQWHVVGAHRKSHRCLCLTINRQRIIRIIVFIRNFQLYQLKTI